MGHKMVEGTKGTMEEAASFWKTNKDVAGEAEAFSKTILSYFEFVNSPFLEP